METLLTGSQPGSILPLKTSITPLTVFMSIWTTTNGNTPNLTGKTRISKSTKFTSEWVESITKFMVSLISDKLCYQKLSNSVTTLSKSWESWNILIMVLSVITSLISSASLPASESLTNSSNLSMRPINMESRWSSILFILMQLKMLTKALTCGMELITSTSMEIPKEIILFGTVAFLTTVSMKSWGFCSAMSGSGFSNTMPMDTDLTESPQCYTLTMALGMVLRETTMNTLTN